MNRKIIIALAIIAANLFALAAEPDPSAWYKPSAEDYIAPIDWPCVAYLADARGMQQEVNFNLTFDENGNVIGSTLQDALGEFKVSLNTAIDLLDETIKTVVQNTSIIERLEAQFVALGKNLTKIFQIDGMRINSGGKTFTLRIPQGALKNAVATGSTVEYTDEDGLLVKADNLTLMELLADGIRMIGWKSVPTKVPSFAILKDNGEIGWIQLKVDDKSIAVDKNNIITIKGWTGERCNADLSKMLSEQENSDRDNHAILTRVGEGNDAELHYLPIGEAIAVKADGESIVKKEDNVISIGGYADADTGQVLTKTDDGVDWKTVELPEIPPPPDVPDTLSGDGIIIDEYWDDEDHLYQTVSVDTNYIAEAIGKIPTADGVSIIEKSDKVFSISGYDDAEPDTVLTRSEGGVEWAPLLFPAADGVSLDEKEDGTWTIAGLWDAADGAMLRHNGGAVEWVEPTEHTFIVDVIWDEETKTIKKKTATFLLYGTLLTEDEDYQ